MIFFLIFPRSLKNLVSKHLNIFSFSFLFIMIKKPYISKNVSKACKIMGLSRDTFYRYQELVETNGLDSLINQNRRVPNLKNRYRCQ